MQPSKAKEPDGCVKRTRLAEEFAIAARRYYEMVVQLTTGDTSSQDYDSLRQKLKDAYQRVVESQTAFETHVDSHKCLK